MVFFGPYIVKVNMEALLEVVWFVFSNKSFSLFFQITFLKINKYLYYVKKQKTLIPPQKKSTFPF